MNKTEGYVLFFLFLRLGPIGLYLAGRIWSANIAVFPTEARLLTRFHLCNGSVISLHLSIFSCREIMRKFCLHHQNKLS